MRGHASLPLPGLGFDRRFHIGDRLLLSTAWKHRRYRVGRAGANSWMVATDARLAGSCCPPPAGAGGHGKCDG
jgi:hypothetical protein